MKLSEKALEALKGFKDIQEVRAFLVGLEAGQERDVPVPVDHGRRSEETPKVKPDAKEETPIRRLRLRGLQADVYRMLHTGAATLETLEKTLPQYPHASILQAVNRLIENQHVEEIVTGGGTRLLRLTSAGGTIGAWFVAHPGMKVYFVSKDKKT